MGNGKAHYIKMQTRNTYIPIFKIFDATKCITYVVGRYVLT